MGNIYFYKMTTDNGAAPCVDDGMLSLAICKPSIRKAAHTGDIVFGFGSRTLGEKLIYGARIGHVLEDGDYYKRGSGYEGRLDCIYEWKGNELVFRVAARVHGPQHRDHDVGAAGAHRRKANVLIADEFVYFGAAGTDEYKRTYAHVKQAIERLTQGHRVNHAAALASELTDLYEHVFQLYGERKRVGSAHDSLSNGPLCYETEGAVGCVPAAPRSAAASRTGTC